MATKVFDSSAFKPYFNNNDVEALGWASNVLEKLIQPGEVSNVIYRVNQDTQLENDFSNIYEPTCIFFAYLVRLSREFRDFKDNEFLIREYLLQNDHQLSSQESLIQLQRLVNDLLRTIAQRGTIHTILPSQSASVPDGEMLRLIGWSSGVFFKLGVAQPKHNGWNVNNSGPLSRSCTGRYDLNLAWENTESVEDVLLYPLLNSSYVSRDSYRGKECLKIEQVPFGLQAGIGAVDLTKAIVIDPRLNYEITFQVAQDITLENITFGCLAFDSAGDQVGLLSTVTELPRNKFFETRRLNKAGTFYQVRGIIYNKDVDVLTQEQAKLNIGFGQCLKFTDDVVRIIPYIVMDNNLIDDESDFESDNFASGSIEYDSGASGTDSSGYWIDPSYDGEPSLYLWNIKVTPCNTAYNRCYLNNKNFIDIYVVNNSNKYSDEQLREILRESFIPYNTAFKLISIGTISEVNPNASYLLLEEGSYILLENEDRVLLEQQ